jgi:3-deoxy-manno-octulosonate cytidylyltransferase (CMP-KDO synthetase)
MPNLNPQAIKDLATHMKKNLCDIGTLASNIENNHEEKDPNVVKVVVDREIKNTSFAKAVDFFRISNKPLNKLTYHHVGIYAFTNKALIRYVSLKRSKLELERKLEQMRALENGMKIDVGYIDSCPLSVDTEEDLKAVKEIMEN